MNGTKKDLLEAADKIEAAAERELRPMATNAAGVLAERGYHDLPAEQLDHHTTRAIQAWQGAMQYAAGLRQAANGLTGDLDRIADGQRVIEEARMVEHAANMGGWLGNGQRGAWDHANDRWNQIWDNGREKQELERGEHYTQQEADKAQRTGVMVHNDFVPGSTMEQVRLVPNPNQPAVEDPRGEIPTTTTRPPADPYPQDGIAPKLHEDAVNKLHEQVDQGMGLGADGQDVLDGINAPIEVKAEVAERIGGAGAGDAYVEHAQDPDAVQAGAERWEQAVKDNTQPKADPEGDEPGPAPEPRTPASVRAQAHEMKVTAGEQQAAVEELQELVDENNKLLEDENLDNEERAGIEEEIAALENEQYELEQSSDQLLEEADRLERDADQMEEQGAGQEESGSTVDPAGGPEQEQNAGEDYFRGKAQEFQQDYEAKLAEADAETDPQRQSDLREEAEGLKAAAEACGNQADYEHEHPLPKPPEEVKEGELVPGLPNPLKDDGTQMTNDETAEMLKEANPTADEDMEIQKAFAQEDAEARPGYWAGRAEDHRQAAEDADARAEAETDEEVAQSWRATAADARNLAEACDRNAEMYDDKQETAEAAQTWPPTDRGPTQQELDDGVAIEHEDGSVAWSPTNDDFNFDSAAEERASGLPQAQAADYSEEPLEDYPAEGSEDWDARTADEAGADPTPARATATVGVSAEGIGWGVETFFPVVVPADQSTATSYHDYHRAERDAGQEYDA